MENQWETHWLDKYDFLVEYQSFKHHLIADLLLDVEVTYLKVIGTESESKIQVLFKNFVQENFHRFIN